MTMKVSNDKVDVTLRGYQEDAIHFLNGNDGKLVLAMCPSSGKTETIIYYINDLYKSNPNIRVLILPHSTNVLLNNFYERLSLRNVEFQYSSDANDNVNVHVILPQNHSKITGEYDLIIVDEAHENYFAKTVQNIIQKTKAQKQILLTGTPYQFISNNEFKIHFVALSDMDSSYIPKLRIDILESDYDWNGNYNEAGELKTDYKFKESSTESSLKKTFDFILNRNESIKIKKTIIVCRNIEQSKSVKKYLKSIGLSCEISNSENDRSSGKISDFKNNLFDILIVVNRARLGYDDIDLINLIDISGTLNPNIIYQMFARLLRGTSDMQKYYIRLTSKNDDVFNSEISTSVALMLTHRNYIEKFNGRGFRLKEIIVPEDFLTESKRTNKSRSKSNKSGASKRKLLIETDDVISFYNKVISVKEKWVGIYKFCRVHDVLKELDVQILRSNYTLEMCIENASKYKTRREWQIEGRNYYQYARKRDWLDECTAHMEQKIFKFSKEEVLKSALQYKDRGEWKKNCKKQYQSCLRNGWLDECTAHMNKLVRHTLESCIESALPYDNITEWRSENEGAYKYAFRENIIPKCTAHMNLHFTNHTLESCMENASSFSTKTEWRKDNDKVYRYAQRKGWLEQCTAHMKKTRK